MREPVGTSVELAIWGDVLAIEQKPGSDVTLDNLDLRKKYLKSESVE